MHVKGRAIQYKGRAAEVLLIVLIGLILLRIVVIYHYVKNVLW